MVFLGADHGGFRLKERLRSWLLTENVAVGDIGPRRFDPSDDYPSVAEAVGRAVRRAPHHRGILLCRSGVGVAMVANKVPGIRAAFAGDTAAARAARLDEDSNVVALAGDRTTLAAAKRIVRSFLFTPFSRAPRHRRRLREVTRIDARYRRPGR